MSEWITETHKELEEFYKGKRVLITGHTGFKGSWLCRMLKLLGAKVSGYGLESPTDPGLFEVAGIGYYCCWEIKRRLS